MEGKGGEGCAKPLCCVFELSHLPSLFSWSFHLKIRVSLSSSFSEKWLSSLPKDRKGTEGKNDSPRGEWEGVQKLTNRHRGFEMNTAQSEGLQTTPATCFSKWSFIGTQPRPLSSDVYALSLDVFMLLWQSWVGATEVGWPPRQEIFLCNSSQKNFADPWSRWSKHYAFSVWLK